MGAKLRRYLARHHLALIALFVALGGTSYAVVGKNEVTSKSIKKGAVKSVDVKDNNLTGKDVNEAKLDDTSIGRFGYGPGCDPPATTDCALVDIRLQSRARVLVIGDGRSIGGGNGACQLLADGTGISNGHVVNPGAFSIVGVTVPLAPGEHTMSLICSQSSGDVSVPETHIAAVSLSGR